MSTCYENPNNTSPVWWDGSVNATALHLLAQQCLHITGSSKSGGGVISSRKVLK